MDAYLDRLEKFEIRGGEDLRNLKNPPDPGSLGFLGTPPPCFQKIEGSNEPDEARYRWLILHAPGDLRSHSFSPPATAAEIRRWYPDALLIEPEPDPEEAQP